MTPTESLEQFFARTRAPEDARYVISYLVNKLDQLACSGIIDKLAEYSVPEKLGDLIAELRMAVAIGVHTGESVVLQGRDAADLRVLSGDLNCTIEVQHKSSAPSFSRVFYPTPDRLATYHSDTKDWQLAACELSRTMSISAVDVQPWIGQALSEPHWSFEARAAQEQLCGEVARWLSHQLSTLSLSEPLMITYPEKNVARFNIRPRQSTPGLLRGHCSLEAYILNDYPHYPEATNSPLSLSEWLAKAVRAKSKIATKHPNRRGSLHVIGLVVDEAAACRGDILANTYLGWLIARGLPGGVVEHYREAPVSSWSALEIARTRGRLNVLGAMEYEPCTETNARTGLIFDQAICEHVDGIIALYYTDKLEFIPNLFSERDIAPLCRLFPRTLDPFAPRA